MLAWVRRDEALRGWPAWLLLVGVNAGVVAGLLLGLAASRHTVVSPSALALTLWGGVAVYLAFGRVRTRAQALQLALPLPARRLWLAHALAVALMGGLLAAAGVGMTVLQERLLRSPVQPGLDVWPLLAHLLAGVVLAVVLLQAPRPRLARIPFTWGYLAWALAVLAGVGALLPLVARLGAAGALLTLGLAVAAALVVQRGLPEAFTVTPLEAGRERAGVAGRARVARAGAPSRWIVATSLARGVSAGAADWTTFPFVLILGGVLGGALDLFGPDLVELRYIYIPLAAFMMFTSTGPRLGRLHHLDPLPLGRGLLFAFVVAPYFLTFLAGYGLGAVGAHVAAGRAELVDYRATGSAWSVNVPLSVRRVAWDGRVPAAVAPSGESHVPVAWPLWRGSRAVLYSPFSAPRGSSRDYVAWQLSRAAEEVYGARIPAREIADRYLESGAGGAVTARGGRLALRRDHPGLAVRRQGPMLPVMLLLVCVPWLLGATLLLRAYRAGVAEWLRQTIVWGAVVALIVAFLALAGAVAARLVRPWLFQAMVEIPVRRLGGFPLGGVAAWTVTAVLVATAYALARRQFARMEVPMRPCRFTLIDFVRDEG